MKDEFEFLDFNQALELADQNRFEALYALILKAQCQQLHKVMPFLFEKLDDETELLLPDNLLHTDSLIRKLVNQVPESSLQEVESIGWLYQFYISDRKAQLMKAKKACKKEEIPAVTQLFTPNWIVKYLVQNSIGRQWVMANKRSPLKQEMAFYIEPAEQTPEVQQQLDAITPDQIDPKTLRVLDPACGSGHILVEAYDLLLAIYREDGYTEREIPRLILENNLYGLDIDPRAVQLAGFALMMKARQGDRRLFRLRDDDEPIRLNLHAIEESNTIHGDQLAHFEIDGLDTLLETFHNGKTYGSLITVPEGLIEKLDGIEQGVEAALNDNQSIFENPELEQLKPLVAQARVLGLKYDAVIANPPYMSGKGMTLELKDFARSRFSNSKSDLFAMFIEHGFHLVKKHGHNAMVTMQSWMFLPTFEAMRERVLSESVVESMAHMGNGVMRIAFGTNATVFRKHVLSSYKGHYCYTDLSDLSDAGVPVAFPVQNDRLSYASAQDFAKIPGSPLAYWVSDKIRQCFSTHKDLVDFSRIDWDLEETSINFQAPDCIHVKSDTLARSIDAAVEAGKARITSTQKLKKEIDLFLAEGFGLSESEIPVDFFAKTTLFKKNRVLLVKCFLSYAMGCLMGRYSLDKPGLVYANSGNSGFDASAYPSFPADDDGIVPLSEEAELAFDQDFTLKLKDFLVAIWGESTLADNLSFIADALGQKTGESSLDTIRRYMAKDFYKDHIQTYRSRPIYWLFFSGKKKAFEGLVYLHRYNEGTLSRMRMEYVVPLQGRLREQIEALKNEMSTATNTQQKARINRKLKLWEEKLSELKTFDANLRHLADEKIELDLDEGVKVNYRRFSGLLAEEKKVTGQK